MATPSIFGSTLFTIFRFKSYLLRKLLWPMLYLCLPTALLCYLYEEGILAFSSNLTLAGIIGAVLGVLLVFRNNTAYDRWWEARKVLGALVNTSRTFAMQAYEFLGTAAARKTMIELILAFAYALKEHLREGVRFAELSFLPEKTLEELRNNRNRPNALVQRMVVLIEKEKQEGRLGEHTALHLMGETGKLVDILGECERIRKTPMPASHSYLLKLFVLIYVLTMPFIFIGTLHWWR